MKHLLDVWINLGMVDWLFMCHETMYVLDFCLVICGIWIIWFTRNLVKFSENSRNPDWAVWKYKMLFKYFIGNNRSNNAVNQNWLFDWQRPEKGFVKINADTLWHESDGSAGIAAVARDENSAIVNIYCDYIEQCSSAQEEEGLAVTAAINLAVRSSSDNTLFESDCSSVVTLVEGFGNNCMVNAEWCIKCRNMLVDHVN